MFQLETDDFVPLLCKLLDFVALSGGDGSSRVLALSIFSYSSEILENTGACLNGRSGTIWLQRRAASLLRTLVRFLHEASDRSDQLRESFRRC